MQWSLVLLFLMGQCCFITCHLYEYHYIKEGKSWTEAQQYCRKKHTDLATVTNMTDMKRLLNISAENKNKAWIGLYDQTHGNRTWHWSLPGVEFNESETDWEQGEPNDRGNGGIENCGFLFNSLKWGDGDCNDKRDIYLCYNESNSTHKYHLIREQKTWLEAQSYCREKHTDLVSGLEQLQDEELKEVIQSYKYIDFGLFRETWRWSDGSSFSFRHWNLTFNNQQHNSGKCAMTVFNDEDRWKDENCGLRKPFICYNDNVILIKQNKSWEEALYYCRHHHHDLVTITNLDDQRWIQEKAKKASTPFVWTGLRYTCTLDFWFWVSDEVVSYQNWATNEPVDDCDMSGAMETEGKHLWRKKNDNEKFNFICSKN